MSPRLPLQEGKFATIVSVYVPLMNKPKLARIKFYEKFHTILASMPKADKLIALGDFNVRVGTDQAAWRGALGSHGTADAMTMVQYSYITAPNTGSSRQTPYSAS
ncbi:hypothetical protein SprV_0100476300 [Sparganum proliferum]